MLLQEICLLLSLVLLVININEAEPFLLLELVQVEVRYSLVYLQEWTSGGRSEQQRSHEIQESILIRCSHTRVLWPRQWGSLCFHFQLLQEHQSVHGLPWQALPREKR